MKTISIVLFLTIFCACSHKKEGESVQELPASINVLIDITDPQKMRLWPRSNAILQLFRCDKSPTQACSFKAQAISDVSSNKEYLVHLPNQDETEKLNKGDDIYHRNKTILAFYDSVKSLLNQFYKENDTTISRDNSECWSVISKNLIELSKKGGEGTLILFSDLSERTAFANAYTSNASFNPERVKKSMLQAYPIPKELKDIRVIVVYQPVDREDDARFQRMLKIYRMILEPMVPVSHQSNNEYLGL